MLLAAERAADSGSPSGPAPRPEASSDPRSSQQTHSRSHWLGIYFILSAHTVNSRVLMVQTQNRPFGDTKYNLVLLIQQLEKVSDHVT